RGKPPRRGGRRRGGNPRNGFGATAGRRADSPGPSQAGEARLDARVALVGGPEVHGEGRQVVHLRDGARGQREVERLDVAAAPLVAAGRFLLVLKRRKARGVFPEAGGAENPVEPPFASAQAAREEPPRPFLARPLAPDRHPRRAAAEGAPATAVNAVGREID